jgi:hypothetical protein
MMLIVYCDAAACRDMTLTQDFDEEEVEGLKVKILAAVASLDRGLAANVSGSRPPATAAAALLRQHVFGCR